MSSLPPRIRIRDGVPEGLRAPSWGRLQTTLDAASRAVAETLFASEAGPPPEERMHWLVEELNDFLLHAGRQAQWVYRTCIVGISVGAPLLIGARPPFSRLSHAQRAEALEKLESSPLGMSVLGAKALLCIVYYEHPDVANAIGYDGGCMETQT